MDEIDFSVRVGSLEPFEIPRGYESAVSVTLLLQDKETGDEYVFTAAYDENGVAYIYFEDVPIGIYEYQVNENYETGLPSIYPDPSDCDGGDCDLPLMEVCYSLPEGESS